ncbi:MAG: S8 family serine peptidase [Candidatus Binataceae bacterium]
MYAYRSERRYRRNGVAVSQATELPAGNAEEELRVAITFRPAATGVPGLTKFAAPLSTAAVREFVPDPREMEQAIYELHTLGFRLARRGPLSASMRCSRQTYEKVFGTKLTKIALDAKAGYSRDSVYFPATGAPWAWDPNSALGSLIDDAYIQWPHIYMAKAQARAARLGGQPLRKVMMLAAAPAPSNFPSATPPKVGYFHLEMPDDVPSLLDVAKVHAAGTTGKGIRVVMVDSGFAHTLHPFFAAHKYTSTVDLAPGAISDTTDPNGHGTGESTNLFAVAPEATFIGIKLDNDNDPNGGASLLEGFQSALQHQPHIITISMGYDLRNPDETQMADLPNSLAALEAEVKQAISNGIVVVFSAGNGHFSFPGMMSDVISAGGVYVDQAGQMQASNYASSFDSKIYLGRHVPDFSGLVGLQPRAAYIMLPVPSKSVIDRKCATDPDADGTAPDDGWAVFSGTSAAAPQLAGVCALLLEKNPKLTPSDIKAILRRTARTVLVGNANPSSSDNGVPVQAGLGDNGAAGAGLVDAFAAWQQV